MKKFLIAVAMAMSLAGCTDAQYTTAKTVIDTTGAVCQVVVAATDPKLAPVCTTAQAIADAIAALVKAHSHTAADPSTAGVPYAPTNDEVYTYLVSHGAKAAKAQ